MSAVKVIGYIAAAIFIFFGILFIWGAFSPTGSTGWIPVGLISVLAGFGLIWFVGRQKPASMSQDVTLKIDLPANVSLDFSNANPAGGR